VGFFLGLSIFWWTFFDIKILARTFLGVDKNDILPFSILCGEKLDFLGVTILGRWTFLGSCFCIMDFLFLG